MSRYHQKYLEEIFPSLKKTYPELNEMELPRLKKIVISMGLAEATKDKTAMQSHPKELALLSGQKPLPTRSKKAISNFKLRENQVIGMMVTLRKKRMFDFLDRFCNIVCPRIRDFRGFDAKGDGRGSFTIGVSDQQIFPEVPLDEVVRPQGMNITFVTSAKSDEECMQLMKMFGFPFKKNGG